MIDSRRFILLLVALVTMLPAFSQLDVVRVYIEDGVSDPVLKQNMEANATHLLSSLNSTIILGKSRLKLEDEHFTKEGRECVKDMWESSAMMCPVSSITEKCLSLGEGRGFQIRNIPVEILSADEDQQEQELVINFNSAGAIQNVMVALEQHRYIDIINANISVTDLVRRQTIVEFVENFRTSYNRKDIEYIENVFSDQALIITGSVIKVKENSDNTMQTLGGNSERIKYTTSSKQEYIKKLKRCFSRNAYINLKFEELEVVRHPMKDHIYGVTLKQHWNSSTYSDVGYLFLMIDFTDPEYPCIQVRTWQPDKYSDGKKIDRDEIFELSDFNI